MYNELQFFWFLFFNNRRDHNLSRLCNHRLLGRWLFICGFFLDNNWLWQHQVTSWWGNIQLSGFAFVQINAFVFNNATLQEVLYIKDCRSHDIILHDILVIDNYIYLVGNLWVYFHVHNKVPDRILVVLDCLWLVFLVLVLDHNIGIRFAHEALVLQLRCPVDDQAQFLIIICWWSFNNLGRFNCGLLCYLLNNGFLLLRQVKGLCLGRDRCQNNTSSCIRHIQKSRFAFVKLDASVFNISRLQELWDPKYSCAHGIIFTNVWIKYWDADLVSLVLVDRQINNKVPHGVLTAFHSLWLELLVLVLDQNIRIRFTNDICLGKLWTSVYNELQFLWLLCFNNSWDHNLSRLHNHRLLGRWLFFWNFFQLYCSYFSKSWKQQLSRLWVFKFHAFIWYIARM